ncbi:hypothetical protein JCM3765_007233 [Sporobolomyces pararoseus]
MLARSSIFKLSPITSVRSIATSTRSLPLFLSLFPTSTSSFSPPQLVFHTRKMSTEQKKGDITSWASKDGEFRRQQSTFRDSISKDGKFTPDKGRYVLYVSLACPWAHRTLIVRKLKGLEEFFDVSIVHAHMGALGWSFYPPIRGSDGEYLKTTGEVGEDDGLKDVIRDPLYDSKFIRELYFKANPDYDARFTVPIVWDKKTETIVNNESSEIIRFMNTAFNEVISKEQAELDLYPEDKAVRAEIDSQNDWVYNTVNNGVYKSGFATTQKAYENNVIPLFESLDRLEKMLEGGKEFVAGDKLTEADVRLYTTVIRFDPVYVSHFKCNLGTIRHDYPNLNRWMKNLYHNHPAFKETTNFEHIKMHYFTSHPQINPTRIVPVGPTPPIESL